MKTMITLVAVETQEEMVTAELSKTRVIALIKAYEKAGVQVQVKEAA